MKVLMVTYDLNIKIPYIKKRTNRHGKDYYYCKITGKRIYALFGTPEFRDEVIAIRKAYADDGARGHTFRGTLNDLIIKYRESEEFKALAPRTQTDYLKLMDILRPLKALFVQKLQPSQFFSY